MKETTFYCAITLAYECELEPSGLALQLHAALQDRRIMETLISNNLEPVYLAVEDYEGS